MNDQCDMCFYHRYNPCRSVQYRWDRSLAVVDDGERASKRFDDYDMTMAVKFLRALRSCSTEKQHAKLARKMPEIYAAYEIHKAGGELELELQARILARHSTEQLAELFNIDRAIIDCCSRMFFAVRDRIDACDYISIAAIGGIWNKTHAALIKRLGYSGGPLILDIALPYLLKNPRSLCESAISREQAAELGPRVQLVERIWKMPEPDAKTALKLMQLIPVIDKLRKESKIVEIDGLLAKAFPAVPETIPQLRTNSTLATKTTAKHQPLEARNERVG